MLGYHLRLSSFILQRFHLLMAGCVPVLKTGKLAVNKTQRSPHGNGCAHTSINSLASYR